MPTNPRARARWELIDAFKSQTPEMLLLEASITDETCLVIQVYVHLLEGMEFGQRAARKDSRRLQMEEKQK